jgi:hypothetical protein
MASLTRSEETGCWRIIFALARYCGMRPPAPDRGLRYNGPNGTPGVATRSARPSSGG